MWGGRTLLFPPFLGPPAPPNFFFLDFFFFLPFWPNCYFPHPPLHQATRAPLARILTLLGLSHITRGSPMSERGRSPFWGRGACRSEARPCCFGDLYPPWKPSYPVLCLHPRLVLMDSNRRIKSEYFIPQDHKFFWLQILTAKCLKFTHIFWLL